jgi:hypothetical protein
MKLKMLKKFSQNPAVFAQKLICEKFYFWDKIVFTGSYWSSGKNRDQRGILRRAKLLIFQV